MKYNSQNTNLSIRHLKCALAVAEERSFLQAANRLAVAPSALTETIKQIERECQVQLFDRQSRPVTLTYAGRKFVLSAEEAVRSFDDSLTTLKQISGLERGHLRIACSPSLLMQFIRPALGTFRQEHGKIDIVIHDDVAERVSAMVDSGEAEIGFAAKWQTLDGLDYREIAKDKFGLVCHEDHPLAQKERKLNLSDIDPSEVIALKAGTGISQMLARSSIGGQLKVGKLQVYSTIAQLMLISQRLGVALLPEYAVNVMDQNLRFIPVSDLDLWRSQYLITKKQKSLSPSATAFLSYIDSDISNKRVN